MANITRREIPPARGRPWSVAFETGRMSAGPGWYRQSDPAIGWPVTCGAPYGRMPGVIESGIERLQPGEGLCLGRLWFGCRMTDRAYLIFQCRKLL
jgi:hypothetical protein